MPSRIVDWTTACLARLRAPAIGVALWTQMAFPSFAASAAQPTIPDQPCDVHGELTAECDAAIAVATDPKARADLLVARAYLKDAQKQYQAAIVDLDSVIALDPANASALHERAYALNTMMRYAEALKDLDAQAKLAPGIPNIYQERAFSHFQLGELQAVYDDRDEVVRLRPNDFESLAGRADAAAWLGRFDQATADWSAALTLAKAAGDANEIAVAQKGQARLALWSTTSGEPTPEKNCAAADRANSLNRPNLIGDCTRAFLRAGSNRKKAEALTVRSMAWLVSQQDDKGRVPDLEIAAALDPGNADWHTNLGGAYVQVRHSWAGLQEFDRSIRIKPTLYALAGRAAAKYNLGDPKGAFADAKASVEIKPNEVALTVLGDLESEFFHAPKAAKDYWLEAYHLGDRDEGLMARLKTIGVDDPANKPHPTP